MSENDMAKIARLVADPHADKDAEINRAEHAAAIAEFNEKAALRHIAALEARVVKLEAALREIGREQSAKTATVAADKFQSIARAALADAPQ